MEIQSVKMQGQGYLLNGTMSVPKANGNYLSSMEERIWYYY